MTDAEDWTGWTTVYTDGSCMYSHAQSIGRGGWAWWVSDDDHDSGSRDNTDSGVMELTAVLEAMRSLPGPLRIRTDYAGLVTRMTILRPQRKPPRFTRQTPLWDAIAEAAEDRQIAWEHVPGHSGIHGNVQADRLAGVAAGKITRSRTSTPPRVGRSRSIGDNLVDRPWVSVLPFDHHRWRDQP